MFLTLILAQTTLVIMSTSAKGRDLEKVISNSKFCLLNNGKSTFFKSLAGPYPIGFVTDITISNPVETNWWWDTLEEEISNSHHQNNRISQNCASKIGHTYLHFKLSNITLPTDIKKIAELIINQIISYTFKSYGRGSVQRHW